MKFIDLKAQYQRIQTEVEQRIKTVLDHGQYILGPELELLEQQLSEYMEGKQHAVAVGSGTDALLMALLAIGVAPGDEVITTPFSFFATAGMIALLGAKPVFVDIEPDTYNIDPTQIDAAVTEKTKAIIAVNLYGQCADYKVINGIANSWGLAVIEDAAQSFGAMHHGHRSCSFGYISCTSFYPSKTLTAYGDSGACFTADSELAEKLKHIRNHGQSAHYQHTLLGINGRMDTVQAAILLEKLRIFSDELQARRNIANYYNVALAGIVKTPRIQPFNKSSYSLYTIEVEQRDSVREKLCAAGVPTAVHYPMPMHLQPALAYLGLEEGSFPVAERAAARVLSLPMHPYLTRNEQDEVVRILTEMTV